jgi:murein DD-endopeptidase MepM/ murein hydrolase activator NlpD
MNERIFFLAYKLPSLAIGAFIIIMSLFIVLFAQGCMKTLQTDDIKKPASVYYSSSSSALAAGLDEGAHAIGEDLSQAADVANGGLQHVSAMASKGARIAAEGATIAVTSFMHGAQSVVLSIGRSIIFTASTAANSVLFVFKMPFNAYGFIAHSKVASSIIAPSAHEHGNVPIIDPNDPALLAAQKALPAIDPATLVSTPTAPQEIVWPMHGAITTYFGEHGRYYHPTHTGIDISDGKRSGVTPIKAYRSGTVMAAGRDTDGGLGNRVIVDHGNGVTSVYGHLYSIAVEVGQAVNTTTTLGTEGSTGVSTGTHLHFEIHINGQAADPLLFISGRP